MGDLIVIAGPTASGKTSLSLSLAEAIDAEIISGDARQFYRRMDIGTAKPTSEELTRVPHHFIDILDPQEDYTAGIFEQEVLTFLQTYFERKQIAILVGGSGLYIKAVIEGFDQVPPTPPAIREHFQKILDLQGIEALQRLLKEKDPTYYEEVDKDNPQRVMRALEAIEVSGKAFSELRKQAQQERPFRIHPILLQPDRAALYERINTRVDEMVHLGLEEEASSLYPLKHHNALQTVGYQEWFDHFDGVLSRDEAILKIKQHTRNYAKRQFTWFRKQDDFHSFTTWNEDDVLRHLRKRLNV